MWKKGELVWVRLNHPDSWIPGRVLDPSEPFGILVTFFDLMKPRYVPGPCIRSFERDFETLIADSLRFRRFVNRALQTHFWSISFGLWCACQPPIDSPYLEKGHSLPCSPLSSDSALGFVREMAVSQSVPLRRLAETNSLTAQILSFRRYAVDLNRSGSVYEEVRESAKLMDRAEEPDWCLDPSYKMDCIDIVSMFSDLSLRDPLTKDIHCCSVDKSWNTRGPVISSDSSVLTACGTMARVSNREEAVTDVQVEENKRAVEDLEDRNDHVEDENKNEKDVGDEKGHSERTDEEDETYKRVEQVEIEEDLNCNVREAGEAKSKEAGVETSDNAFDDGEEKAEESSRSNKKVDLRKMPLGGEWFKFMEVQLQKQIVEETEKKFEQMRIKDLRVDQYIAEQKQAKRKKRA